VAVLDRLQQLLGGGDPEAAGAAQASTAMQPMTQPWLDKVLSGEMARGGIQDVNDAFASRDPVALAGSFGPSPLGIRAYHGSPHSFDRFDLSKIGTGEGAQAYGHGLYFAESEPVALDYRSKLARPAAGDPVGNAWDVMKNYGVSKRDAIEMYELSAKQLTAADPATASFHQATADAIKSGAVDAYKPPGHMYEVDIKGKPEDFLNWYEPLGQQSPTVQGAVQKLFAGNPEIQSALPQATGESIIQRLMPMAGYGRGGAELDRRVISEKLGEAGIPGTRYSDQGSRGYQVVPPSYTGEQWRVVNHNNQVVAKTPTEQAVQDWMQKNTTSNYAIWTPEIVTILRRYGLLPPLAAGGLLAAPGRGEAAPP
jgi:hypothetical protein